MSKDRKPAPKNSVNVKGLIIEAFALVATVVATILGVCIREYLTSPLYLFVIFCAIPAAINIISVTASMIIGRRLNNMSVAEVNKYLASHREEAEKTSQKKLRLLAVIRLLSDFTAVLVGICAAGIAASGAVLFVDHFIYSSLAAFLLSLAAFSRIRFPRRFIEEDKQYVKKADYPKLYELAEDAAKKLGAVGEIRILLDNNVNVCAAKIGKNNMILIGAPILAVMSEAELYAILLHESAHIADDSRAIKREINMSEWLSNGGNGFFNWIFMSKFSMFILFNNLFGFEYALYSYSASILKETAADSAIAEYGDRQAAASELIKLKYNNMFEWENYRRQYFDLCPETPEKGFIRRYVADFKAAMNERAEAWKGYIDLEIPGRNDTHPTTKMRLEALGVTEYKTIEDKSSEQYANEVEKAIEYVEDFIIEALSENYDEIRKVCYTESLETVNKWTEAGSPVVAEEYPDIYMALVNLSRFDEADALCDRAIAELPEESTYNARFQKGCRLLHSYDASGLDYLYTAIENNHNYIEEGLATIGLFCCFVGMKDELEVYREKAVNIAQHKIDEFDETGVLKKGDNLSAETGVPAEEIEKIISTALSTEPGAVENLYLFRKTINESYFASPVVIRFAKETDEKIKEEIYHKVFMYLDNCAFDWQYSLFDYDDVCKVGFEKIEGSCIYEKKAG